MKFAKIVFWGAAVWGILLLTPMLFAFDAISQDYAPQTVQPGFYFGFLTVTLAFQFVFVVIATDPIRFRPVMLPAMLEKFGYGIAMLILYAQERVRATDMIFVGVDAVLGVLFIVAYLKTRASK